MSSSIPVDNYLDVALDLSLSEIVRFERIWGQLPSIVVDAHTHIARRQDLGVLPADLWSHAVSSFPWYSLDTAARVRAALWCDVKVWSLRMPHATGGYFHRAINEHLVDTALGAGDAVGGYGLPDDIDYTVTILESGVSALKMYYRYREPAAESLREVFPDRVLQAAADLGTPVVVHLPQPLPLGLADLCATAHRFPSLRIIVAHAGGGGGQTHRADLVPAFEALSGLPTVWFDTALVWDRPLLAALLGAVGPDRMLFGTDEPLSLLRAVPYEHARLGPRLYAPRYHWALDDGAPRNVVDAQPELLHLIQVEALLDAVTPYGASAVQAVFHDNAAHLFHDRAA